jgi:hypothetical protein
MRDWTGMASIHPTDAIPTIALPLSVGEMDMGIDERNRGHWSLLQVVSEGMLLAGWKRNQHESSAVEGANR